MSHFTSPSVLGCAVWADSVVHLGSPHTHDAAICACVLRIANAFLVLALTTKGAIKIFGAGTTSTNSRGRGRSWRLVITHYERHRKKCVPELAWQGAGVQQISRPRYSRAAMIACANPFSSADSSPIPSAAWHFGNS